MRRNKSAAIVWACAVLLLSCGIGLAIDRRADHVAPKTNPAEADGTVRTVIAGHAIALGVPVGWNGDARGNGTSWAGAWSSKDGVALLLTMAPHKDQSPMPLEKAADLAFPQLIAKQCPWLHPGEAMRGSYHGYPMLSKRLSGEKDKGKSQSGMIAIVDAGPAIIIALSFGPDAAAAKASNDVTAGLNRLVIDNAAGPYPYPPKPAAKP